MSKLVKKYPSRLKEWGQHWKERLENLHGKEPFQNHAQQEYQTSKGYVIGIKLLPLVPKYAGVAHLMAKKTIHMNKFHRLLGHMSEVTAPKSSAYTIHGKFLEEHSNYATAVVLRKQNINQLAKSCNQRVKHQDNECS
jgi:hypothetical protein